MKAIFFIFIFSSPLLFVNAQIENKKSNTEQVVRKLMKDWMIAMLQRDEKTLNKIVAPEFKLDGTDPFDKPPVTRQMWMANTMKNLKVDSVHYYKMKVDLIDNIAIVQSTFYWSGSFYGRPFIDSTSVLVDTWMKRKLGCQVVRRLRVN